jgi:hypothetical protein
MLIRLLSDGIRGTIWTVTHDSMADYELNDCQLLSSLSDFFALFLRNQANERQAGFTARAEASPERARAMAHQINNSQRLTNTLKLGCQGGPDAQT